MPNQDNWTPLAVFAPGFQGIDDHLSSCLPSPCAWRKTPCRKQNPTADESSVGAAAEIAAQSHNHRGNTTNVNHALLYSPL